MSVGSSIAEGGYIGFTLDNVGIDRRIYTGLTSTNGTFNVSYNAGRVDVYLNGVKLVGNHSGLSNYDYTYTGAGQGSNIVLATGVALVAADVVECIGYVSNSSNTVTTYNPTPASGGGWNVFSSINHVASDLVNVYMNGVLLDDSDYTLDASANTLTIGGATLTASDVIMVQVIGALDNANFVPAGGGTFTGAVGIGVAPTHALTVQRDGTEGAMAIVDVAPSLSFIDTETNHDNFTLINDADNFKLKTHTTTDGSSATDLVTVAQTGNVTVAGTLTATFPAGHIIQIVQTVITGTTSGAVTSYTDISGFTASITPASTSNKILVQVSANIGGNIDEGIALQLVRGSTAICIGDASGSRTRASANFRTLSVYDAHPVSITFLDSPSSTSATTYKLQWQNLDNDPPNHMYLNKSSNSGDTSDRAVTASSITLMEVQG